MREILFKAKWLDNGEWIEGYLMDENYINVPFNDDDVCGRFDDPVEINSETICQYTGLTDKNGQKIWENDICEMVYDGVMHVYVVVWDREELDFKGTNGKENYGENFEYLGCCEELVVIGNIFDNPELLEVE